MFGLRFGAITVGKIGYLATCLVAAVTLVASGYAHKVVSLINSTASGITINDSPNIGPMNILVMGLESRTNYQGQELDHHLLYVMHTGSNGAQDTNTLILIHIPAGGQKAVGFSIPRDDLVTYPRSTLYGITRGKIDQAYDFAYNESLQQTSSTNDSQNERYLLANQAGQRFEIDTVQAVTGVHIDHFVEANLAGFYYLAQAFGGIEVCAKPYPGNNGLNLTDYDPYTGINHSGFNAYLDGYNKAKGGAQYLHLSAAQSLAFVRSRDTLPGTDIGRTARQQATIDYVVWELRHRNVFSDSTLLTSLLGTASQYLITDSTFSLLDFATNLRALSSSHMTFTTLPISGQINGMPLNGYKQDVNIIDIPTIQRLVKNAFYPQPAGRKAAAGKGTGKKAPPVPAPSTVTVDVYNGNPTATGLARRMSAAIVALGYKAGAVSNASEQSQTVQPGTQVFYGAGAAANAEQLATQFGITARPLASLQAHHVEVLIGSTVTTVPAGLVPSSSASASTQSVSAQAIGAHDGAASHPAPAPSARSTTGNGGLNSPTTVAPNAPYGIPCVY